MFRRRTLEETKTVIPLPLRPSLSQPSWTILLTVLKTMRKAIEAIPTEERTKEIVMNIGQDPITKTLGISWNSTKDVFTVTSSAVSPEFQTTKRNVLRKVATNFDPLGLYAHTLLWPRSYSRSCGCEATTGTTKFKMKYRLVGEIEKSARGEDSPVSATSRAFQVEAH